METEYTPLPWPRPFTSALNKREAILVLLYMPIHMALLQWVLTGFVERETLTPGSANLVYYALGFGYMLLVAFGFLRRDYDALADRPLRCIAEVLMNYGLMLAFNMLVGSLLLMILPEGQNPNNQALMQAASQESRAVMATVTYLAPLTEEMMFRAGVFGLLRRKSRTAAYVVSVLLFSLYHVLPYAVQDPVYWLYLVQYLPASFLLARCYERSNSIWCSTFFHMLVNGVSFSALQALEELM